MKVTKAFNIYHHQEAFKLESGRIIPGYHLAYTTYGNLDQNKSRVVWVFHALTANSDPADWWPGLIGIGKRFDPSNHFIICVNMPGSCYGSISPLDKNPENGTTWFHDFPYFTPRDMARVYIPLRKFLGIDRIHVGIGGSMGAHQMLEWAIEEPDLFEHIIPIATNAKHSSWGRAFTASQRMAIENDPTWLQKDPDAGRNGMKIARSIALLGYRNYECYNYAQQDDNEKLENFKSESYQRYQGEKIAKRFNAFSYYFLTKGLDAHNVGRGRDTAEKALKNIKAKTLVIGVKSDLLYPSVEQQFLAEHITNAKLELIDSFFGHDGFLLEYEKITSLINTFIQ
ncbi:MAG: homoserine O-acetyltransferase family protein [Chitinophagaceae bacterium]